MGNPKPQSAWALAAAAGLIAGLAACDAGKSGDENDDTASAKKKKKKKKKRKKKKKGHDDAEQHDKPAATGMAGKGDPNCCVGKNDCKGKGGCKTASNACKGKNDCKGKGGCDMRDCS